MRVPICTVTLVLLGTAGGCADHHDIEVDPSSDRPRFVIHDPTWGWPFRWPRVHGFAVATRTRLLWELKSLEADGVPARQLAIIYGDVPAGFYQVFPEGLARPDPLEPGETYLVGATGSEAAYRAVFALPLTPLGAAPDRPIPPPPRNFDTRPPPRPGPPEPAEPAG